MMLCKFCGADLADGARFCPDCGSTVEMDKAPAAEENATPTPPPAAQPDYSRPISAKPSVSPASILVFGILSILFCVDIALLGLIFARVAQGKAKRLAAEVGALPANAKAGKVLATIGGIISTIIIIVAVVAFIGYLILVVAGLLSLGALGSM